MLRNSLFFILATLSISTCVMAMEVKLPSTTGPVGQQVVEEKTEQKIEQIDAKKAKKCCSRRLTCCEKFTLCLGFFAAIFGISVKQAYDELNKIPDAEIRRGYNLGDVEGERLRPVVERACQNSCNSVDSYGRCHFNTEDVPYSRYDHFDDQALFVALYDTEGLAPRNCVGKYLLLRCDKDGNYVKDRKKITAFFCEKEKQIKTGQCLRKFKIEDGEYSQIDWDGIFTDNDQPSMWTKLRYWACKKVSEEDASWLGAFMKIWTRW